MENFKLTLIYFSPTGTTKKTLENIAEGIGINSYEVIDMSDFNTRWEKRTFCNEDLVIFGMPVYYGRLPVISKEIFDKIKANSIPVVPIVVYGNREYEDALLELKNELENVGFKAIAAAAFIGEHSLNSNLAKNRPDNFDKEKQIEFGRLIKEKYLGITNIDNADVQVPGKFPYKGYPDVPLAPQLVGECNNCKICSDNCPAFAIDPNNAKKVDNFRCILCFRCVRDCPNNSRDITNEKFKLGINSLQIYARIRKEPEIFI